MLVSIIVKALNEERRIAACLEAALAALAGMDAEVILVDSVSTDRTVAIAQAYPVRIVQFDHVEDRGCGAAVELGWRYSRGQFIYVLDADMLLQPGFLQQALAYLGAHPQVAGVGGNLIDTKLRTLADQLRSQRTASLELVREVDELGGGGLYRRVAIAGAGYLANRALFSYEEADLGLRLRALGWKLIRLPLSSVTHEGHDESNWQMLLRLWTNGRAKSPGTLLRSAVGTPWFFSSIHKLGHIVAIPFMHLLAVSSTLMATLRLSGIGALAVYIGFWLTASLVIIIRKRSVRVGLWHLVLWHYWTAGTLVGLFQRHVNPFSTIAAHEIPSESLRVRIPPI